MGAKAEPDRVCLTPQGEFAVAKLESSGKGDPAATRDGERTRVQLSLVAWGYRKPTVNLERRPRLNRISSLPGASGGGILDGLIAAHRKCDRVGLELGVCRALILDVEAARGSR